MALIDPIEQTPPLTLNQSFEYDQLLTPQDPGLSNINRMPQATTQTLSINQNESARIDMGQMMRLKEMGYEVAGPVNGPNEGLPQYEVLNKYYAKFHSIITSCDSPCGLNKVSHMEHCHMVCAPIIYIYKGACIVDNN